MSQDTKFFIAVIAGVVIALGAMFTLGGKTKTETITGNPAEGGGWQTGPTDAKVTIVEYGDFQCPACASAEPAVREMIKNNSDKVQFIFRHFPLPMHANASLAARAAEAAGKQNQFWAMHDLLYDQQRAWSDADDPTNTFVGYAKELNLDEEKFKQDLASDEVKDAVSRDMKSGDSLSVNQTPTFFINNQKVSGAQSLSEWQKLIDAALAN